MDLHLITASPYGPIERGKLFRLRVLILSVVAALALTPAAPALAAAEGGTIAGTLTTAKGAPVAGIRLQIRSATGKNDLLPTAVTDETGHYSLAPLPAGRYRVGFYFPETLSTQWVPQTSRETAATWFTVRSGETTVVDESLLAVGGLQISLNDPATGPIAAFCVDAIGDLFLSSGCTTDGTLLLSDLPIGSYLLMATDHGTDGIYSDFADVTADTVTPVLIQPL